MLKVIPHLGRLVFGMKTEVEKMAKKKGKEIDIEALMSLIEELKQENEKLKARAQSRDGPMMRATVFEKGKKAPAAVSGTITITAWNGKGWEVVARGYATGKGYRLTAGPEAGKYFKKSVIEKFFRQE